VNKKPFETLNGWMQSEVGFDGSSLEVVLTEEQ
jgi:hypothetical protein